MAIDLGFAFLAGVLTIFAPCILPMLPIILGSSLDRHSSTRPLFIVLGFVLSFSLVTLFVGALTQAIGLDPVVLRNVGAVLIGLMGLSMLLPDAFQRLTQPLTTLLPAGQARKDNWGGFLLGTTLGLVWAPCAGPVLASILVYAATAADPARAALLLAVYSVGAGVPMLLIAYGGQYASRSARALAGRTGRLHQIFGVMVIAVAVAIFLGYDARLTSELSALYPDGRAGL